MGFYLILCFELEGDGVCSLRGEDNHGGLGGTIHYQGVGHHILAKLVVHHTLVGS